MRLTQPAVSEQIRRLERDYDVLLFKRDRKQLQLTPAGSELFKHTRHLFELEDQIEQVLTQSRASIEGRLRIVADSACHITNILRSFRRTYPEVRVQIRTGNSQDVLAGLRNYEAEIGIAGSVPSAKDLEVLHIGQTPIVAFAAKGMFSEARTSLTLRELIEKPVVLREHGSTTRRAIEDAAFKAGFELEPAIEAEGREAVREIVASGMGVGFVSMAEFGNDERVRHYEIEGANLSMHEHVLCLAQRRDVRVIQAFRGLASAHVASTN